MKHIKSKFRPTTEKLQQYSDDCAEMLDNATVEDLSKFYADCRVCGALCCVSEYIDVNGVDLVVPNKHWYCEECGCDFADEKQIAWNKKVVKKIRGG